MGTSKRKLTEGCPQPMQRLDVKLALQNLSAFVSQRVIFEGTKTGNSSTVVGIAMMFTEEGVKFVELCCWGMVNAP